MTLLENLIQICKASALIDDNFEKWENLIKLANKQEKDNENSRLLKLRDQHSFLQAQLAALQAKTKKISKKKMSQSMVS